MTKHIDSRIRTHETTTSVCCRPVSPHHAMQCDIRCLAEPANVLGRWILCCKLRPLHKEVFTKTHSRGPNQNLARERKGLNSAEGLDETDFDVLHTEKAQTPRGNYDWYASSRAIAKY
eukprot:scaffold249398_cov39-Tisochrysis_lutea.AAC.2